MRASQTAATVVAHNIKRQRELRGMSQSDLARAISTDPSHVAHWESGRREPSLTNAATLATALGCSVDHMLGRPSDYDTGYRDGYFACREDMKAATRDKLRA